MGKDGSKETRWIRMNLMVSLWFQNFQTTFHNKAQDKGLFFNSKIFLEYKNSIGKSGTHTTRQIGPYPWISYAILNDPPRSLATSTLPQLVGGRCHMTFLNPG